MTSNLTKASMSALLAVSLLGGSAGMATMATAAPVSVVAASDTSAPVMDAFQLEILNLTNQHRANNGLAPLTWSNSIANVAQDWTNYQLENNEWKHNPNFAGQYPAGWTAAGENIAANESAEAVFYSWVNSEGHNANLLNPEFTEMGVGYGLQTNSTFEYAGMYYVTQNLAGYPVEEAPVAEAPVEEAPVEEAPVEEAPVEEAPVEEAPVEEAPVEEAPVEEAPVEEAPVEEAPVEEAPVEEAPVEEAPVEEAPVEEAPVEEAPVEEAPVEEAPVEEAPVEEAPVEEAPVEEAPVEEAPVEEAPVEEAPVEEAPVEEAPVEEAPVEEAPVEEAPVEEAPVEEAPVEEAPVEEAPVEEAPVEEAPVEEAPVEEAPVTDPPAEEAPVEEAPSEEAPANYSEENQGDLTFEKSADWTVVVGGLQANTAYDFVLRNGEFIGTLTTDANGKVSINISDSTPNGVHQIGVFAAGAVAAGETQTEDLVGWVAFEVTTTEESSDVTNPDAPGAETPVITIDETFTAAPTTDTNGDGTVNEDDLANTAVTDDTAKNGAFGAFAAFLMATGLFVARGGKLSFAGRKK